MLLFFGVVCLLTYVSKLKALNHSQSPEPRKGKFHSHCFLNDALDMSYVPFELPWLFGNNQWRHSKYVDRKVFIVV